HNTRFGQTARLRESQQFLVGAGIPQEERKTRGQFKIAESRSSPNPPIKKIRTRQHSRHDLLDSLIETPSVLATAFVEPHEASHLVRGYRPAVRAMREGFGDLPSAFVCIRAAHEDEVAAESSGNTLRVKGTADHNAVDQTIPAPGGRARAAFGQFVEEWV